MLTHFSEELHDCLTRISLNVKSTTNWNIKGIPFVFVFMSWMQNESVNGVLQYNYKWRVVAAEEVNAPTYVLMQLLNQKWKGKQLSNRRKRSEERKWTPMTEKKTQTMIHAKV